MPYYGSDNSSSEEEEDEEEEIFIPACVRSCANAELKEQACAILRNPTATDSEKSAAVRSVLTWIAEQNKIVEDCQREYSRTVWLGVLQSAPFHITSSFAQTLRNAFVEEETNIHDDSVVRLMHGRSVTDAACTFWEAIVREAELNGKRAFILPPDVDVVLFKCVTPERRGLQDASLSSRQRERAGNWGTTKRRFSLALPMDVVVGLQTLLEKEIKQVDARKQQQQHSSHFAWDQSDESDDNNDRGNGNGSDEENNFVHEMQHQTSRMVAMQNRSRPLRSRWLEESDDEDEDGGRTTTKNAQSIPNSMAMDPNEASPVEEARTTRETASIASHHHHNHFPQIIPPLLSKLPLSALMRLLQALEWHVTSDIGGCEPLSYRIREQWVNEACTLARGILYRIAELSTFHVDKGMIDDSAYREVDEWSIPSISMSFEQKEMLDAARDRVRTELDAFDHDRIKEKIRISKKQDGGGEEEEEEEEGQEKDPKRARQVGAASSSGGVRTSTHTGGTRDNNKRVKAINKNGNSQPQQQRPNDNAWGVAQVYVNWSCMFDCAVGWMSLVHTLRESHELCTMSPATPGNRGMLFVHGGAAAVRLADAALQRAHHLQQEEVVNARRLFFERLITTPAMVRVLRRKYPFTNRPKPREALLVRAHPPYVQHCETFEDIERDLRDNYAEWTRRAPVHIMDIREENARNGGGGSSSGSLSSSVMREIDHVDPLTRGILAADALFDGLAIATLSGNPLDALKKCKMLSFNRSLQCWVFRSEANASLLDSTRSLASRSLCALYCEMRLRFPEIRIVGQKSLTCFDTIIFAEEIERKRAQLHSTQHS